MKNVAYILAITLTLAGALLSANPPTQQSQSAEVLLGAALHQEEVEGNLEEAIKTYQRALAEHADNRPLAAKALLQIGHCYERLGKDEARKAYERLVRDYADQSEQAKLARVRLAALSKTADVNKEPRFTTRQVWTGPDMDFEGSPSPNGRYLSFTDWETGDLAVRDLETGTNRRLTNKGSWEESDEFVEFSRWSHDGKRIAYDWYDGKCCIDLHVISAEGGKPRILVNHEDDSWMQTYDWSPDGKQILTFLEKKGGTCQIVLVSAANGKTTVLKTFEENGEWPQIMRFSRDGQYIAYDWPQEQNPAEFDIYLISADGGREFPLVKHPADDRLLGWPPDGKGILFASDRTGSLDMWFLPISGGRAQGAPEPVKEGAGQIVPMGFTQNGSFYYAQGQQMSDVYVATMDPQSGKSLAPPEKAIKRFEGANSWPDYSFDGKNLAYLSTRSHSYQANRRPNILCIRSIETGKEREFTTKFNRLAGPRWAPDGHSLYLASWDNQGMGIYRVNVQNGEFSPMVRTQPPASLHRHEISPDGNIFIYGRRNNPKESYRIISRNLINGEEKQLYEGDRTMFSISPDGQWLALINVGKKKALQVMPVRGGKPTELLRFEDATNHYSSIEWSADSKYILFSRPQPTKGKQRAVLWRIPLEGGEPQQLSLVMYNFQEFRAHPDGLHLVFDSFGFTKKFPAIWVMENFLPPAASASK